MNLAFLKILQEKQKGGSFDPPLFHNKTIFGSSGIQLPESFTKRKFQGQYNVAILKCLSPIPSSYPGEP